jgi:localization factor PodJL
MTNRSSIYDQLNTGRQRRSASSLDDLEATIGGIEARLDRMRGRTDSNPASYSDEIAERMRKLSNQVSGMNPQPVSQRPQVSRSTPNREMDRIASEVERARFEEAQHGHMASIMTELQSLRADMRRLAANPQDDWGAALGKEIAAIKNGIGALAREDTLRSVENRWSQIAQQPPSMSGDPIIEALLDRIDSIQNAVTGLPQSLSITSLEEKIRVLAGAIDQMSRRNPEINPGQLVQIEDRLDEISRAIVASSVSVQAVNHDKSAFERIEVRLGSLNGRIDELMNVEPVHQIQDRIGRLAEQIDMIASRSGAPTEQMVRLASQMEVIADKISQLDARDHDTEAFSKGMEDRLFVIASRLEQSQADTGRESLSVLSDLESRLEEMAAKLSTNSSGASNNSDQILAAVEQRFSDLSRQIHSSQPDNTIDPVFAENIERRLAEITQRLNQSTASISTADPAAFARLESQVSNLSQQLSTPRSDSRVMDDLAPRLESIEKSLASNHETLLAVAKQAAEDAMRNASMSGAVGGDSEVVYQLANDLKALDILARKSDDRNAKTFEAIHDTLLKIVDRLGSLETTKPSPMPKVGQASGVRIENEIFEPVSAPVMPKAKIDLGISAPSVDAPDFTNGDSLEDFEPVPVRSPAEAAMAAANAAREMANSIDASSKQVKAKPSLFSGLSKVLRREEKITSDDLAGSMIAKAEPMLDSPDAAPVFDAHTSNDLVSGTPDLNAIMKRVRDERRDRADGKPDDTAKNDFLAAARRAAQAAAADAEILKNKNAKASKAGKSGLTDMFQRQRKPILMGALAIMLALTGLQLGKAFIGGSADTEVISDAAPKAAEQEAPKSADVADVKATEMTDPAGQPDKMVVDSGTSSDSVNDSNVRVVDPAAPADVPASVAVADIVEPSRSTATPTIETVRSDPAPTMASSTPDVAPVMDKTPAAAAKAPAVETVPAEVGPIALREAASTGDTKAMFEIAGRYTDGRGVTKDLKKAVEWYQKAADAGFAPAQFRLGSFYEKGLGVERSADKAKTLYQLAAEQGNASAMHNLAVLFAMGASGPADNDSAARWFVKAAELGVKDSQYNLGILAAKGLGVPQNLEESYKWFALAAKGGDKDAASKRDEIANAMRPEQLQKARATTELWKAKPVDAATNAVEIPDSWKADAGQTASTSPADMTKAIRNIQIILNQNGYDAGAPDGKMGGKTKTAIAAYQKANGMAATGEVDETLVKSLLKKVKS